MTVPAPHFLLYSEAALFPAGVACIPAAPGSAAPGRWHFVLRRPGDENVLEAADEEAGAGQERLELLAIVRGLEALDQPSRVTLVSPSRSLRQGLQYGLAQWRENNWQWERFGQWSPIKNGDLWQRLDRLLQIHTIQCRPGSLEWSDDLAPPRRAVAANPASKRRVIRGRRLRFDGAAKKHERRSTQREMNSKSKRENASNEPGSEHPSIWNSCLLRISCFVLRALRTALWPFFTVLRRHPC